MKIKFYGHNCYSLSNSKVKLVIDPWLNEEGAFMGSWFQWPLNHHLMDDLLADLAETKNSFIYISHEHQDHFDIKTLNALRSTCANCIIPNYFDKFLKTQVETLGFNVIELKDREKFALSSDDTIELLIVDTGVNHDSAAIIDIGNKVFLNQNDCKVFDRLGSIDREKIDYYAVQFSGATWHPACYDYSNEEKRQISRKKINSKLTAIKKAIKVLKPSYYMPSAGPAIFPYLEESLSLGDGNIFVHQTILEKYLSNSDVIVTCLTPGEVFEAEKATPAIAPPTIDELRDIKQRVTCQYEGFKDEDFDVAELMGEVQLRLDELKGLKYERCPKIFFNWGNADKFDGIMIDLNKLQVMPCDGVDKETYMLVEAEPRYFYLMSHSAFRWQDVYLSLRAKVSRNPAVFNTFVNIFLFSDVSNIRKAFETTLNIDEERILRFNEHDGKTYEIYRYCPHNGADLIDAEINADGMLICPRHAWQFDMKNGGKCHHADVTIEAKELVDTITLCETISARLVK